MSHLKAGATLRGGAYEIKKVLGQGSFGITYLAKHTSLDRAVAIKEFFMKELNSRAEDGSITGMTDGSLSFKYAEKFRKEASNLARMKHPNIVEVTDAFEENGTCYYVMDFVEGENLNDYIRSHRLSENEAVSIARDIATALQYMHEQHRMLHLDLKPGNVMRRSSDGHIFLIDFGLSKHYSNGGQPETSTTIGLGTPGYAPIEQGNQAKDGDFRPTIDIYALGATLFKLLTGNTPPNASDIAFKKVYIQNKLTGKGVSTRVAVVVSNAMAADPSVRTATARDFIARLSSDALTIKQTRKVAPTVLYKHKFKRKKESHLGVKFVILAVIGVACLYFLHDNIAKHVYDKDIPIEQVIADAEKGNVFAQDRLGNCYYNGHGVAKDYNKAVKWYRLAAEQGEARAQKVLGWCYESGRGVAKDKDEAIKWLKLAARQGNESAQQSLRNLGITRW